MMTKHKITVKESTYEGDVELIPVLCDGLKFVVSRMRVESDHKDLPLRLPFKYLDPNESIKTMSHNGNKLAWAEWVVMDNWGADGVRASFTNKLEEEIPEALCVLYASDVKRDLNKEVEAYKSVISRWYEHGIKRITVESVEGISINKEMNMEYLSNGGEEVNRIEQLFGRLGFICKYIYADALRIEIKNIEKKQWKLSERVVLLKERLEIVVGLNNNYESTNKKVS